MKLFIILMLATILSNCASTPKPLPFHFDQQVTVDSKYNFYNGCSGRIVAQTWLNSEMIYFVKYLCREDVETYFFARELKLR